MQPTTAFPHPSAREPASPPATPTTASRPRLPSQLVLDRLCRRYGRGGRQVQALSDVTVRFAGGTLPLSSARPARAKSTLPQCAAGLDKPTSGSRRL